MGYGIWGWGIKTPHKINIFIPVPVVIPLYTRCEIGRPRRQNSWQQVIASVLLIGSSSGRISHHNCCSDHAAGRHPADNLCKLEVTTKSWHFGLMFELHKSNTNRLKLEENYLSFFSPTSSIHSFLLMVMQGQYYHVIGQNRTFIKLSRIHIEIHR